MYQVFLYIVITQIFHNSIDVHFMFLIEQLFINV